MESLLKRGQDLQQHVKSVRDHIGKSYQHLTHELDYESRLLDALVASLKSKLLSTDNENFQDYQVHAMEEQLLHLENRILEEIATIKEVGHNHQPSSPQVSQLITRANKLISEGNDTISRSRSGTSTNVSVVEALIVDIKREVANVESQVKMMKQQSSTATTSLEQQFDEELYGHELTMRLLIKKVSLLMQSSS